MSSGENTLNNPKVESGAIEVCLSFVGSAMQPLRARLEQDGA